MNMSNPKISHYHLQERKLLNINMAASSLTELWVGPWISIVRDVLVDCTHDHQISLLHGKYRYHTSLPSGILELFWWLLHKLS